jgi:hypothetical protein
MFSVAAQGEFKALFTEPCLLENLFASEEVSTFSVRNIEVRNLFPFTWRIRWLKRAMYLSKALCHFMDGFPKAYRLSAVLFALREVESLKLNLEDSNTFMFPLEKGISDMVYERKLQWTGIEFITENLRVDEYELKTLERKNIELVISIFKSNRVRNYMRKLEQELFQ